MWSDQATTPICPPSQQVPMMTGLQAKRKRDEEEDACLDLPALKCGRGPTWPSSAPRPTPRLNPQQQRAPMWALEDPDSPPDSDDDEDDDELDELECRKLGAPQAPYCYPLEATPPSPAPFYPRNGGGGGAPTTPTSSEPYCPPGGRFSRTYWPPQYCYPPPSPTPTPTRTIRCAENGKSYLELGSAASTVVKSRAATYRQQRLTVLNLSMCKLSRFRQFPDPSLHRSVLICNTLRRIEREMEQDSVEQAAAPQQPAYQPPLPPVSYPATPPPQELPFYEHNLRDLASPAPRSTPFPSPAHPGASDDSSSSVSSSINWGSVLSLSSQSDLDPLNNNAGGGGAGTHGGILMDELDDLPSWRCGDDSVLKSLERTTSVHQAGVNGEELVDSLMQVLVGT